MRALGATVPWCHRGAIGLDIVGAAAVSDIVIVIVAPNVGADVGPNEGAAVGDVNMFQK